VAVPGVWLVSSRGDSPRIGLPSGLHGYGSTHYLAGLPTGVPTGSTRHHGALYPRVHPLSPEGLSPCVSPGCTRFPAGVSPLGLTGCTPSHRQVSTPRALPFPLGSPRYMHAWSTRSAWLPCTHWKHPMGTPRALSPRRSTPTRLQGSRRALRASTGSTRASGDTLPALVREEGLQVSPCFPVCPSPRGEGRVGSTRLGCTRGDGCTRSESTWVYPKNGSTHRVTPPLERRGRGRAYLALPTGKRRRGE